VFKDQNELGLLCVQAPTFVERRRGNVHRETKGALRRASKSATQPCFRLGTTVPCLRFEFNALHLYICLRDVTDWKGETLLRNRREQNPLRCVVLLTLLTLSSDSTTQDARRQVRRSFDVSAARFCETSVMSGTDGLIDLTGSPDAIHLQLLPKRRRACSAMIDVTGGAESEDDTVDLSWPAQQNEAGPSHYMQPATLQEAEATGASGAACEQADAPQTGKGAGKRKRAAPAESARQAETKQQEAEARRAAAKKRKEEARATKKAAEQKEKQTQQKRVDQYGRIVRYSSNAPMQTKERMARAMPSML